MFNIPSFITPYVDGSKAIFDKCNFDNIEDDLELQLAKLGTGLLSGEYSVKPKDLDTESTDANESQPGIRPVMFKNLIGKGHPEFSGKQQQDAQEFYLHLMTILERKSKANPGHCFQFEVEDRLECGSSGQVKYLTREEDYLPLPIPIDQATNTSEVEAYKKRKAANSDLKEEIVRPKIDFQSCLKAFCVEEEIHGYYSPAVKENTVAKKTMRLKTFPDYLLIQLKKFDVNSDWVPYKVNKHCTFIGSHK